MRSQPRDVVRRWQDGIVLATAALACVLGGVFHVDDSIGAPPATAYVVAVLSSLPLVVRRRSPLAALVLTTAAGLLVVPLGMLLTPVVVVPLAIAAYALSVRASWQRSAVALTAAVVVLVSSTLLFEAVSWQDASRLTSVAAVVLVSGVLGQSTQNRRAYLEAMEERARRAEETRDSEARRRVNEERVRIARELHDLVAHQITLANAQAMVAAELFESHPEQTRKNLDDLVDTTRDALDDLRATVGLLRQPDEAVASAEPSPALSRLPTLAESFGRAGLEVSVRHDGAARPLPPGVDLTAYRIIQEALTNVTKHAGALRADVRLVWHRDRVSITVSDDGTVEGGGLRASADRSPGFGLIGMRERASAVGGELSAGVRPEGGFAVVAHLPLPPPRPTVRRPEAATSERGVAP